MHTHDIYTDPFLEVPNNLKFKEDLKLAKINKLCMTDVVNADLSIAAYGEDVYNLGCKDVLKNVQMALDQMGLSESISLYSFNYKKFILAGNNNITKDSFLSVMKQFYAMFESAASSQVEISAVSRFAVVLQEDRLIERALHAFLDAKNSNENFIIAPDKLDVISATHEDAKVLDFINFAMDEKRVVPFYQGIRNNKTGKIEKYEALMRIVDADGKVHSPFFFLDVAKKYKIYNKLSQMMIDKALDDFKDRKEYLSVNISAYDISSEEFRKWFINKLKNYPHGKRLVIEFVETENYQGDLLFDFIKEVREYGCTISADDFGSGYATYSAIIALSPEFIKVDGSIIKNIVNSKENVIILRSICFMAELVGAKIVAEFVETQEIQDALDKYNVAYSQGYLYSKPLPIAELPLVEKKSKITN